MDGQEQCSAMIQSFGFNFALVAIYGVDNLFDKMGVVYLAFDC